MAKPQPSSSVAASVKRTTSCDAIERELAGLEDIAYAANRFHQLGSKWVVHLCAQTAHDHIDHVGARLETDVPNLLNNFRARNNFARRTRQMFEEQKFFRCQI